MYLIPVLFTIVSIILICFSVDYLIDIKDCKVNYERNCYEKQQIELKGKLISEDNVLEIGKWIDKAQNFNNRFI